MAAKANISTKPLLLWDEYSGKEPTVALALIYAHTQAASTMICAWYWTGIRQKRRTSMIIRVIAFLLLTAGTASPIFAGIMSDVNDRLRFTQAGVALLAISGLILLADRVFGWSSGWIRYIMTVTTMENLSRAFQLEWTKYILSKGIPLDASDVTTLFLLARALEQELAKLQAEETTKWAAEFNTGISLLESLIKSQHEETDRKLEAIRTGLPSQEAAAKADDRAKSPGSVEVTLVHKTEPRTIKIGLDGETQVNFTGQMWSKLNVTPGHHVVSIQILSEPPQKIEKVVEVQPSEVSRVEVKLTS